MEDLINIRLDLGINAQKFIQQVRFHNENLEIQIAKGIELALNELCEGDNFAEKVRKMTKIEVENIVHKAIISYDTKRAIEKALAEKIGKKIEDYANQFAEKITANSK